MKRKALTIVATLLAIALIAIPVTSCNEAPASETPTNPVTQLQSQVNNLSSTVNSINSRVAGLETAINNIDVPAGLEDDVASLADDVANIEDEISQLPTPESIATSLEVINVQLDDTNINIEDLDASYAELEAIVAEHTAQLEAIQTSLDELAASIVALQDELDSIGNGGSTYDDSDLWDAVDELQADLASLANDIEDINDDIDSLKIRVTDVETFITTWNSYVGYWNTMYVEWAATPRVAVSQFEHGTNLLKFKTKNTGDYIVILTLYGSFAGSETFTLTPVNNTNEFEPVFSCFYGSPSMWVIGIQPKTIGTIEHNWLANQEVLVVFNSNIGYATIATGVR